MKMKNEQNKQMEQAEQGNKKQTTQKKPKRKKVLITVALMVVLIATIVAGASVISKKTREKKIKDVPVLKDTKYDGFEAEYIGEDLTLFMDSKGKFSYHYEDGEIYKDYDLCKTYTYNALESEIYANYDMLGARKEVLKVKTWTPGEIVIEENGEEKKFSASYFIYFDSDMEKPEGVYDIKPDEVAKGDIVSTYEFSKNGTVQMEQYEYDVEDGSIAKGKGTCKMYYNPLNEEQGVRIYYEEHPMNVDGEKHYEDFIWDKDKNMLNEWIR